MYLSQKKGWDCGGKDEVPDMVSFFRELMLLCNGSAPTRRGEGECERQTESGKASWRRCH